MELTNQLAGVAAIQRSFAQTSIVLGQLSILADNPSLFQILLPHSTNDPPSRSRHSALTWHLLILSIDVPSFLTPNLDPTTTVVRRVHMHPIENLEGIYHFRYDQMYHRLDNKAKYLRSSLKYGPRASNPLYHVSDT